MPVDAEQVRSALVLQWQTIAAAVPNVDLDRPSRIDGWRNREVLAHLYVQPILLGRFLQTASDDSPTMDVTANLAGTGSFGEVIDASAREGADIGKFDFARALDRALPDLLAVGLGVTISTLQGSILLVDYLVTRCVEAVVHGMDLVEPVEPDQLAQAITADALIKVLASRAPDLVSEAQRLSPPLWIDVATGRRPGSGALASALPVMT
jgi:hypothetical protein